MKVSDIATGRSGDKGSALDLTLVARTDADYAILERAVTAAAAERAFAAVAPSPITRYALPGLRALKFVAPAALPGGVYASLHAGLHWQKAAIYVLLDLDIET